MLLVASAGELRAVAETQLCPVRSEALGKHGLYKEIAVFKKTQTKTIINHKVAQTFTCLEGENSSINNKSKQSTLTCFTACAVSSGLELKRILGEKFLLSHQLVLISALSPGFHHELWSGKHSFPLLSPGVRFPLALNIQYLP